MVEHRTLCDPVFDCDRPPRKRSAFPGQVKQDCYTLEQPMLVLAVPSWGFIKLLPNDNHFGHV